MEIRSIAPAASPSAIKCATWLPSSGTCTPTTPITTWKWLRAMVEHEAHHRGQIYLMLSLLEVATPPAAGRWQFCMIFGGD
jgi:uncharacterized damage-inducible protein DinB